MHSKKREECPRLPFWLTTFADLMSLLLTFFVLLFSMSTISEKKFLSILQTIKIMWGVNLETQIAPSPESAPIKPIQPLYPKVEKWSAAEIGAAKAVKILKSAGLNVKFLIKDKKLVIRIPTDGLFNEGSYVPNTKYLPLLKKVCDILKKLNAPIRIEGHTDSLPIYKYPLIVDNWDLSLLRAVEVVKYFVNWGFPKDKISAAGYADTEPVAPNRTPQDRAKNRRIDIVIFVGATAI